MRDNRARQSPNRTQSIHANGQATSTAGWPSPRAESTGGMDLIPSIDSPERREWLTSIHGPIREPDDVCARRSRSRRATERLGLRRLRADRRRVGAAPDVHGVRSRRLLRLVQEQACDRAFPSDAASDRSLDPARGGMGLVLCRPAVVRKVGPFVTSPRWMHVRGCSGLD